MSGFLPSRRDYRPDDPFADPLDAVLAEVAINIHLPPGLHAKAVDRYEAVRRYIERPGSPLEARVTCFYPQGSMAIDATTSTRGTDDEYDLDIVVEIDGPDRGPAALLDDLEAALEGYPVSRIVAPRRHAVAAAGAEGERGRDPAREERRSQRPGALCADELILRVATIIDGLALAMIDGEVGLGGS